MGVCQSSKQNSVSQVSNEAKSTINPTTSVRKKTQKLLILGAGESGKSTILKQMRLLHCEEFSDEEKEARKGVINSNIKSQMAAILSAMNDLNINLEDLSLEVEANRVLREQGIISDLTPFTSSQVTAIKALWADAGVQQCYVRRAEYQLNDSAKYFIESIDRISADDYQPNVTDMLHSRTPTTGVVQLEFTVRGILFFVYDVGGQRSERKKWIHCFDDVNAILYVMAISEYDQTLREDSKTNRLMESISLFESICNSMYFTKSAMLIFFNKTDLFQEKLEQQKRSFAKHFPNYRGAENCAEVFEYMQHQLDTIKRDPNKALYIHQTCATNTDQVQKVVTSVIDMIIERSFNKSGMV